MKAKANSNYPAGPVVAFGGFEFVRNEWRDVPPGCEGQAEEHPYLDVLEEQQLEAAPVPTPEPEKPKPKPRRRTRRKITPKVSSK